MICAPCAMLCVGSRPNRADSRSFLLPTPLSSPPPLSCFAVAVSLCCWLGSSGCDPARPTMTSRLRARQPLVALVQRCARRPHGFASGARLVAATASWASGNGNQNSSYSNKRQKIAIFCSVMLPHVWTGTDGKHQKVHYVRWTALTDIENHWLDREAIQRDDPLLEYAFIFQSPS